ncbi:hypothetical protein Ahy_B07g087527 [Arachis hypogaea]|uniref:Aminotransferase-like plant mobile domain-containing protein n=1 Tax=Arachis hypogaea TaxID=3818 RepID=A0A444YCE5_ARAHY|nr:hypothetical protein Ahy_B07g087527 [Arachis hypogaea]
MGSQWVGACVTSRLGSNDRHRSTWRSSWVPDPPHGPQQGAQRKESFSIKITWLQDRVCHMPPSKTDPVTLRQYTRCYIMLLIGGYLMTDMSNNQMHIRWLLLLADFGRCNGLSWESAGLAWTYHSLCHAHIVTPQDSTSDVRRRGRFRPFS